MPNTLIRWPGWSDYPELRHRFDQIFEELVGGEVAAKPAPMDVVEDDGKLIVRADMPGIKPDEIEIEIADDVLTITGEHTEAKEQEENGKAKESARFLRRERSFASYARSLTLPSNVDPSKIEASCHDGVVEVTVPLSKDEPKVVQIKPKAA